MHQYRDLDGFLSEAPGILQRITPRVRFSLLPPVHDESASRVAKNRRAMELPEHDEQRWVVFAEIAAERDGAVLGAGEDRARASLELDRQRILLELLRPHLELACSNARQVTAQRTSARAGGLARFGLTPREADVAHWLAAGKTNAEIASILGARSRTIEKHVERVLEKLGVENRTAAALLISSPPREHP
ncbi:MAG: helix-turn-helix transcriptional regulator [Candidatus Eisenbacteria bacterium]